jgi:hypothetical protein
MLLRALAADFMRLNALYFAPFLPYEEQDKYPVGLENPTREAIAAAVDSYCTRLTRNGFWGGQPEVRALACCLRLPIVVHQADAEASCMLPEVEGLLSLPSPTSFRYAASSPSSSPSTGASLDALYAFSTSSSTAGKMLRISYHKHFYTMGEHYNSVVARGTCKEPL